MVWLFYYIVMAQLIQTIIKKMINFRSLASTTNNNLQGAKMPNYGFAVLMFVYLLLQTCQTCACLI